MAKLEAKTGFIIRGSTGCSCCRCDNFASGIYEELESAEHCVKGYQESKICASQYSPNGNYEIRKIDYEVLTDEVDGAERTRFIIDDMIFDDNYFHQSGEDEYYRFGIGEVVK